MSNKLFSNINDGHNTLMSVTKDTLKEMTMVQVFKKQQHNTVLRQFVQIIFAL